MTASVRYKWLKSPDGGILQRYTDGPGIEAALQHARESGWTECQQNGDTLPELTERQREGIRARQADDAMFASIGGNQPPASEQELEVNGGPVFCVVCGKKATGTIQKGPVCSEHKPAASGEAGGGDL